MSENFNRAKAAAERSKRWHAGPTKPGHVQGRTGVGAPLWWLQYATGGLKTIAALARSVLDHKLSQDGTDTTFLRFTGEYKDPPQFVAPERLRQSSYFNSDTQFRHNQRANWHGVDWRLKLFAGRLMEAFRQQGVPLFVVYALRDEAEQEKLYAQGRTAPGKRVTNARFGKSPHNFGAAVDIIHGRFAYQLTPQEWQLIGKIGKATAQRMANDLGKLWPGVTWGGDWGWDMAHWELKGWEAFELPEPGPVVHIPPRALLKR